MALVARFRISLAIVIALGAALAGVFGFARPEYDSERGSKMMDIAELHHYPLADVRVAFAEYGLPLRYDNAPSEPLWLSSEPLPSTTDGFFVVYVARRSGTMSWGPEFDDWEARFGNVLVHYGGDDAAMLARIKSAVDELD